MYSLSIFTFAFIVVFYMLSWNSIEAAINIRSDGLSREYNDIDTSGSQYNSGYYQYGLQEAGGDLLPSEIAAVRSAIK